MSNCKRYPTLVFNSNLVGTDLQSSEDVVVVDAALLFETGWNVVCDQVAFVDSNEELRLGHCQARGWSIDELRRREASQWSLERKRQQADFVIENRW